MVPVPCRAHRAAIFVSCRRETNLWSVTHKNTVAKQYTYTLKTWNCNYFMYVLLNYKLYQLLVTRRFGKILWSDNYFSFHTSNKRKLTHGSLYNLFRRHYGMVCHDTWTHHSILGVSVLQTTVLTGTWKLTYRFSFYPFIPLFFTTQAIFHLFCADVWTCPTSLLKLFKF